MAERPGVRNLTAGRLVVYQRLMSYAHPLACEQNHTPPIPSGRRFAERYRLGRSRRVAKGWRSLTRCGPPRKGVNLGNPIPFGNKGINRCDR
jgi:hypothetical protein